MQHFSSKLVCRWAGNS